MGVLLSSVKSTVQASEYVFKEEVDGVFIDSFFSFKSTELPLVVMLSGSVNRSLKKPPVFQRSSWSDDINANVLSISEPALMESEDLTLGWSIGTYKLNYTQAFSNFIGNLISRFSLNKERLLFFGSSAGGFSVIQLATYISPKLVLVNNPQINVFDYYKKHVDRLIYVGFPNLSVFDVKSRFLERFSIVERLKKRKLTFRLMYYQNVEDKFHYTNHLIPLLESLPLFMNDELFELKVYSDVVQGHSPLSKEKTLEIINNELEII